MRVDAVAARIRHQGRTAAVAVVTFGLGVLTAALLIPGHDRTGVAAGGSSSGSGSATVASGSSPTAAGPGGAGVLATSAGGALPGASGASQPGAGGGAVSGSGPSGSGGPTTPAGGNGGATAAGVTGSSITLGILGGNSQAVAPACPRCAGISGATDQAIVDGMIAAWHKAGKLPVYGRDLKPVFQSSNDFDTTGASGQAACENLVADKPFVTLTGAGAGGYQCLAQQYHMLTVDAAGGQAAEGPAGNQAVGVEAEAPYMWELGPSMETVLTGWASWAGQTGLLKGQVLGLYEQNDATDNGLQEILDATFVAQLKALGYHLSVDYAYNGEGQSDDPIAVARMRNAGVTVVFVSAALAEPAGFQNQAQQLGYHPRYPVADQGSYAFTDALADVSYNANAENGDLGLGYRWWNWSARHPATPADNQAAAQCLSTYEAQTRTTLDVYNDDALIRYLLDECSDLDVILAAVTNAGPALTTGTFLQGIERIHDMQTPEYQSVSFGPGQYFGDSGWQSQLFGKARWQPSNDYWKPASAYTPWSVWPQDQNTISAAVRAGE